VGARGLDTAAIRGLGEAPDAAASGLDSAASRAAEVAAGLLRRGPLVPARGRVRLGEGQAVFNLCVYAHM
jgi:hypothetical protein